MNIAFFYLQIVVASDFSILKIIIKLIKKLKL